MELCTIWYFLRKHIYILLIYVVLLRIETIVGVHLTSGEVVRNIHLVE